MVDYISRQAAIDSIVKQVNQIFYCNELMTNDLSHELAAFALSQELIKDLPSAQPAQKWIPCSERKPEKEKYVLICTDTGIITDGIYHGDGEIIEWDGAMRDRCFDSGEVIAWMPLPDPYKEGEEDG